MRPVAAAPESTGSALLSTQITAAFQRIDANGDGVLDQSELYHALKTFPETQRDLGIDFSSNPSAAAALHQHIDDFGVRHAEGNAQDEQAPKKTVLRCLECAKARDQRDFR